MKKLIITQLLLAIFNYYSIAQLFKAADSVEIIISNLGKNINSDFPEYAPLISADGLVMIYTSRRPYTKVEKKKNNKGLEKVFISNFSEQQTEWLLSEPLPEVVNNPDNNISAIAFSNDGQKMLLYKDDRTGNGDIFESTLSGNNWSEPVSLGEPINSKEHESSASYSPDGRTLYFISNRAGGLGGRDIWQCTKDESGIWGKPVNLGRNVNSNKDEESVYCHPDGRTLFFSSQGFKSIGGFDVYYTTLDKKGKWTKAINLGTPINTKGDDVCFVMLANSKKAYYTSVNAENKDIFQIDFNYKKRYPPEEKSQLTLLKGVITDIDTKLPLEAKIEIVDNEKNELIANFTSNSTTGKYLVSLPAGRNYGISVNAEGYLFFSENINIPDSATYQEIVKNVELKKLTIGNKIVLKNIFFDYSKATLRSESISEINRLFGLLKQYPTLNLEISGHTDNIGTEPYNQKLSEERAKAVFEALIVKGIDKERLKYVGYNFSQPIAPNDSEEGRQLNRRTEIKILSK